MTEKPIINVYCDESCHLQNDHQPVMVLGGVWLPKEHTKDVSIKLRQLKEKHGLKWHQEIKWNKVSPAQLDYYNAVVDFFFDNSDLHFRGLIVQNKDKLNHAHFVQDHNTWYYKMYFSMLKQIFNENHRYHIYLDIKDTRGGRKIRKLHDVICNSLYDFDRNIIERLQLIRSEEAEILQLADLFIGALGYVHRGLTSSAAKQSLIEHIKARSGHTLTKNTLLQEEKFNLFLWQPQES
jgi:hypothetical protein